jgi:hypothetical protein
MGTYLMIVQSQGLPGHEEDLPRWYDEVHFREMCAIPGVVSARRYLVTDNSPVKPAIPNLAIYEIEADDIATVSRELYKRTKAGEMTRLETLDRETMTMTFYEQKSEVTAP